ncbi:MAG: prephenate dehydrogenase [Bifidobacteriaceae bacterium]|jgi:prephenate dehydrogenase|nr:prephenate dehydrogenase [Bifidobacteriaceae bacterium]
MDAAAAARPAGGAAGPTATRGPVRIVGAGLLGASIGMALTRRGVAVALADTSPLALAVAEEVGAGARAGRDDPEPALVVVATPPDVAGGAVAAELAAHPGAAVTDVASVKSSVLAEVVAAGADLTRYVGSHPMAGRERRGAAAALPDLFVGRPWVIADSGASGRAALLAVRDLAVDLGARAVHLDAAEHDSAVALVSHVPQVVASVVAARLAGAPVAALDLAGQGLRDVTRIAASDPVLWGAILMSNAAAVAPLLREVRADLDSAIVALDQAAEGGLGGALTALNRLVARGNEGVSRVPGKHGGGHAEWDWLTVLVPDRPGQLGALFTKVGQLGFNLEDVQIEHAGGRPVGLAALSVARGSGAALAEGLAAAGWRILA